MRTIRAMRQTVPMQLRMNMNANLSSIMSYYTTRKAVIAHRVCLSVFLSGWTYQSIQSLSNMLTSGSAGDAVR